MRSTNQPHVATSNNRPPAFAALTVSCPKTGRAFQTGYTRKLEDLSGAWARRLEFICPDCNDLHQTTVRKAYIEQTIATVRD